MSSIRYNMQSMNGLQSLDDGSGGLLEDGVLTCTGVVSDYLTSIDVNTNNSITAGQSVAIGKDISIGNSVVTPNIYTTKIFVSNILETKKIKTDKIHLSNNLQTYDESTVGFINQSPIKLTHPLLTTNTNKIVVSLPLPIGVYSICYCFTLALSAISTPSLHSLSHGVSTDGINLNVIQNKYYGNLVFNDLLSYSTFHQSGFFHVTDYNTSLSLIVKHHTATNTASSIVIENAKIKVMRIA